MIRDRDSIYGAIVTRRLRSMGHPGQAYCSGLTHLALEGASLSRTVKREGRILCRRVLGGLHHE